MRATLIASIVFLAAGGCDSSSNGINGRQHTDGGVSKDGAGSIVDDLAFDHDAFFVQDPPVMYCGLDGGAFHPPPVPGGTLQCPDDKNLPGCPCTSEGMTAPCFTGSRANRNLGVCKDGVATCQRAGEVGLAWSDCVGQVLPTPGATSGANACKCFSHGFWNLDNLSPCQITGTNMAESSVLTPGVNDAGGMITCPTPPATGNWSNDQVTVDCAGHFTLCYTLKAGDGKMPMAGDCTVSQVCTTGDYTTVGVPQTFPPLPAWNASSACVMSFFNNGGYGEMSVKGTSLTCDQIPDHVFQRVIYCKPGDTTCQSGGGGGF